MKKTRIHDNWEFWKVGNEANKQVVRLPYDAMIHEKRIPDMENGSGAAYFPGGKYYYSKKFFGDEKFREKSVIIEFEGVYMNSSVFLNGEKVGGWIYGYTNFFVNLTGKIRLGEENELLVEADNSKTPNSRWYSGSGIYRPVNMWVGGENYIKPQGLMIKTISLNPSIVEIKADYTLSQNASSEGIEIEYKIYDGEKEIAFANGEIVTVIIDNAKLWSCETPFLYQVKAVLKSNGVIQDETVERFGIRTLSWNSKNGLMINENSTKLKGGCIHHDNGILGANTYDKAEYRRIKRLKEFGFNAIRYSHYPAGKNLLDICDEIGMYVLDETFDQWRRPNLTYDYSIYFDEEYEKDTMALARKDYNHPSVIMYSIGNEITDTGRSYAPELAGNMYRILNEVDGTRPVTIANNAPMSMVAQAMEKMEGEKGVEIGSVQINELITANPDLANSFSPDAFTAKQLEETVGKVFDEIDIAGHNYAREYYPGIHELRSDRVLLSTETLPKKIVDNWKCVEKYDYLIGDFHWTAWDYLGETGVGLPVYGTKEAPFGKPYPCLTAACGSFDLVGNPEAAAYYAAIIWNSYDKPYIGVRPVIRSGEDYTVGLWRLTDAFDCWTWRDCEGIKAEIIVYSIGSQVELYQDGNFVDRKDLVDYKAEFETTYVSGELEAISYDEYGKEINREVLKTAGEEVEIVIVPEETDIKANSDEIVFVPIYLTDKEGIVQKTIDKKIHVSVKGVGELIALGSANPETEDNFSNTVYTSWHGCVLAIVRCSGVEGEIVISAAEEGYENTVSARINVISSEKK